MEKGMNAYVWMLRSISTSKKQWIILLWLRRKKGEKSTLHIKERKKERKQRVSGNALHKMQTLIVCFSGMVGWKKGVENEKEDR